LGVRLVVGVVGHLIPVFYLIIRRIKTEIRMPRMYMAIIKNRNVNCMLVVNICEPNVENIKNINMNKQAQVHTIKSFLVRLSRDTRT
jgi:hypothetical protein